MAERISGAARGLESYAFLYFGAGLGLGVVHQGRLIAGAFGNAGEIGHIPVPQAGATVALEDAVSRLAAQRHLRAAGIVVESGEDLARLHATGDPALAGWLDRAAEPLAAAIAIVENLFDPEAVILGGAMPEALLDTLIARLALTDRSVAHRAGRALPRVLRGTSGRMTATYGAAALVIAHAVTPMIAAAS
jgi:predicted NBD/HSP70 family sugar kinase